MRIQARLLVSIVASFLVSAAIVGTAFIILQDLKVDLERSRSYDEALIKVNALNVLLAEIHVDALPSDLRQLQNVQTSLSGLLQEMFSKDVLEESLIQQIQTDNERLGFLLAQLPASSTLGNRQLEKKQREILDSQLWISLRRISDDIYRLRSMSQSRVASAQNKAGLTVFSLLIALLFSNSIISVVSGRKIVRAEEALRESEERLRLSTEMANVAVWEYDFPSNSMSRSRNHDQLYGMARQEHWDLETFTAATHPDDRAPSNAFIANAVAAGGPDEYTFDFRVIHPDQSIHWLMASGQVVERNPAGQGTIVRGCLVEITERKQAEEHVFQLLAEATESHRILLSVVEEQKLTEASLRESEQRYRTLFESIDEGFCVIEMINAPNGKAVDYLHLEVNPAFQKLTGLSDAQNKTMRQMIPELEDFWFETYGRVARTGESIRFEKLSHGLQRYYTVFAFRIGGDESQKVGIIFADISARKQAEQEIQRLNSDLERRVAERTMQLEKANQELEGFSYSVSHDLRAPLRAINGFSSILLEKAEAVPDELQRYLKMIHDNGIQMGRLIDGLLNFSRLGRKELETSRINLESLVQRCVKELAGESDGNVDFQIQQLPAVQADPLLLKQVIQNLLSNAVKYSRTREKAIIEVGSLKQDARMIFFVRDNGVGFDMRYAHKLFGVFQRLHLPEEFEGTGIGLALTKKIIERHGGQIWAEAEVDHGATFYFTLQA